MADRRVEPVHARVLPAASRRASPSDGIFCQWAQLYEMAPWNIKTILRHRARGVPLRLRVRRRGSVVGHDPDRQHESAAARLRRRSSARFAIRSTRAEARRGGFQSPHDVFAYLLLGPEELESFTAGVARSTPTTTRASSSRRRAICSATPSSIRTCANVYGPMWPYGRLTELVRGYDGAGARRRCGLLARSLLAHGKARESELWTRRAEAAGNSPEAQHARLLLNLVSTRLDRDPEIPLAPGEELAPPAVPGYARGHAPRARREGEGGVPRRARPLPRPPLRHRLQGAGEVAGGALDRASARTSRC